MDQSQKHYVKGKKPNTKDYTLYDSFTWNLLKGRTLVMVNRLLVDRNQQWEEGTDVENTKKHFGVMEIFYSVILAVVTWVK